ncbi:DUF3363 domain-containing protein [Xanthomonas arboricola]|uniref:DUF3363 domain-containing protein n=1 Tax=Xanthomonas arboricola TaxID=56448 RepID=UPI003CE54A84
MLVRSALLPGARRSKIAAETGSEHRSVDDGQRVAGIYRRSVMFASGRFANVRR